MRVVFLLLVLLAGHTGIFAQKYSADKGQIVFFSDAPLEDIRAVNTVVGSLFNASSGDVVFIAKIRDFVFEKSLMREHFNEKYMESEKFPKATFQGKITGFKTGVTGEQKVQAVGKLTMHGVTKDINVPGIIAFHSNGLSMKSTFIVKLEDYNIKIPRLVWQNIAEDVEVKIEFTYKPI
jgi:hypothetical protein